MQIETNRLLLKTISTDDVYDIHMLNATPEVAKFSLNKIPENVEETSVLLKPFVKAQSEVPRKNYSFKIVLKESGDFIGIAGITLSLDIFRNGELYYKLLPKYRNKGFATEVCKVLIEAGFKTLNLHRIEANTNTDNEKSVNVLEKSGMLREGVRRKVVPMSGQWKDGYLYAIVEDDCY